MWQLVFQMGVSLNGGKTPHFTPQVLIIFSRKPMGLLGKPTILGLTPQISGEDRCLHFAPPKPPPFWVPFFGGKKLPILTRYDWRILED